MGLLRSLLLGDLGNHLDTAASERRTAQSVWGLHRKLRRNTRHDRSQDERIAALEREKEELEIAFAALIRLLHAKNVVMKDELESLATAIEAEMAQEKQHVEEEQTRARETPSRSRKKLRRK